MKEYYKQRWHWVFNYTSKNFGYCLLKTLCLIVGLPIYSVMFVLEMVLTAINMVFSWIPILNTVIFVICKALMFVFGSTFYICILTDIKKFKEATSQEIKYDVTDAGGEQGQTLLGIEAAEEKADSDEEDGDTEPFVEVSGNEVQETGVEDNNGDETLSEDK